MDNQKLKADAVQHPAYYNKGKIEVWDFIKDQSLDFDLGNAVKYICRAGDKQSVFKRQDLEKAANYIQHEIACLEDIPQPETEDDVMQQARDMFVKLYAVHNGKLCGGRWCEKCPLSADNNGLNVDCVAFCKKAPELALEIMRNDCAELLEQEENDNGKK